MSKVYEYVTNKIMEQLNQGIIPWQKPWKSGFAMNYITRKPYRGINLFLLEKPGEYLTFNQIKSLGGYIKKGAKANMVVFFKVVNKAVEGAETLESNSKKYFILRYYKVFHLDDVEGIESKLEKFDNDPIEAAENVINGYKDCPVIINDNPGKAFYRPSDDIINVPPISAYPVREEYYSTLFHECVHSTGHKSRLDRFSNENKEAAFGGEEYSKEELVAEMGAAMLCGVCRIENLTIKNSANYIGSWLKRLKEDNRFLVYAAAQAQKAVDYILGSSETGEEEE